MQLIMDGMFYCIGFLIGLLVATVFLHCIMTLTLYSKALILWMQNNFTKPKNIYGETYERDPDDLKWLRCLELAQY